MRPCPGAGWRESPRSPHPAFAQHRNPRRGEFRHPGRPLFTTTPSEKRRRPRSSIRVATGSVDNFQQFPLEFFTPIRLRQREEKSFLIDRPSRSVTR